MELQTGFMINLTGFIRRRQVDHSKSRSCDNKSRVQIDAGPLAKEGEPPFKDGQGKGWIRL
jgi:hypothetical protein